ncbi:hypothetical protein A3I27_00165 [Candidatus Giovannonibacteria bacterium RIFCSPLOWO2_02_FULL_43_11b]|uniref:Glycosyltransferase 2-like domain-containing protein n=1 Tax=Candidatus Giovannonibacteria bacterium RIFCSPHIGHO2_12_FULL_43_15 TaxID=1798341 RepID=A0A1F5WQJ2_9BACT|nr:MAG: hypothetical protein A2739_02245 [Candidatus Giovannonibacteria bacterium RIFCSPHIGHO2_01_FULL_43_100]OGF67007.1 MAG: hypothetical protein A3B97_00200 [Candidatus Giovannonibacteria bacterium RIFCSPHIGHO2_02_FULL_43_32]OGF77929.1 MAG: hypothetical protein A3F23_04325 [Candidatus Giovannonibacteria bacterium RIFCSPHIGHO2_12_FULL_43_15]OGF78704.1 MAG: hypothetical protein A3A15_02000 [Candidatus Giovannonibacteria bacterium RIFCSPLOWO2_01_FULL_43_60]OGF89397.1 MAG: hypothetical protein A3
MRITVIIPTYNEAQTIERLLRDVRGEFSGIPNHEFKILVVDANSPDGTGGIVKTAKKKYPEIELLAEKGQRGLGLAYIAGMNYAREKLEAEAIMEFDGDYQHDPKDIKKLVGELDRGHDYVIGSRYIPGGSVPEKWSARQKFLSKYGSWFIKKTLALPTYDNTSGFKLSRVRGFYDKLPLDEDKILSHYHAYKIHLLCEMLKMGAKTKEVPIKFLERKNGSSKSTARDILESLKVVSILKLRSFLER